MFLKHLNEIAYKYLDLTNEQKLIDCANPGHLRNRRQDN